MKKEHDNAAKLRLVKMADRSRELCVGGKPISSLRVVDLKVELEKRSLPKSGSKKDLLERLRLVIDLVFDS